MPTKSIGPQSAFLVLSHVLASGLPLIRELGEGGLQGAMAKGRKAAAMVADPGTCFQVARVLMAPEIRPVREADPRLMFKYLGTYISADLSPGERAAILIEHYGFIRERVNATFFQEIVDSPLELWRHAVGGHTYRICLAFPRTAHDEGDLALVFRTDDVEIYTLGFAIGPASIAGEGAGRALYIARVQGKPKGLHLIRGATKHCLDVSPAAVLLAAAEGVATALDVRHMIGVGASCQLSATRDPRPDRRVAAYDEFWTAVGGVRRERNLYHLPVPAAPKPIQAIQRAHRRRALRKRAFRALVTERVCHAFRDCALAPAVAAGPSPAKDR